MYTFGPIRSDIHHSFLSLHQSFLIHSSIREHSSIDTSLLNYIYYSLFIHQYVPPPLIADLFLCPNIPPSVRLFLYSAPSLILSINLPPFFHHCKSLYYSLSLNDFVTFCISISLFVYPSFCLSFSLVPCLYLLSFSPSFYPSNPFPA